MKFENGIDLRNTEGGLLVRQFADAYLARRWQLTEPTVELVETALSSGLRWMIRAGHPQAHARWPSGKGRAYLAFSPTREQQWSLAVDAFRESRGDYAFAVFNGKYHQQFLEHQVPFEFEKRNRGSGHLVVRRDDVLPTVRLLANFDHEVLYLRRNGQPSQGFATEYDIQRKLILDWSRTVFSRNYQFISDEFPVDAGLNPRRIDVLARHQKSGDWLVVEIKRAEAKVDAIHQVEAYLLALGRRDDFLGGEIHGAIVAERVPSDVRRTAERAGIDAYECPASAPMRHPS